MKTPDTALLEDWRRQQEQIRSQAIFTQHDLSFECPGEEILPALNELDIPIVREVPGSSTKCKGLQYIGGLDISFRSLSSDEAVGSLVVMSWPDLKVLEVFSESVKLENPYIPSFLSFREAAPLVDLLERYRTTARVFPQILLVDGNGRLHERQCGSATAIGVLSGVPTIGIAKEYHCPCPNLPSTHWRASQKSFRQVTNELSKMGEWIGIPDATGSCLLGGALKSSDSASRAIFVSPGHRIGLLASLSLASATTKVGRVPEPIRIADQHSRQEIIRLYGTGRS